MAENQRRRMTVSLLLLLLRTVMVAGSEFPERECCDSVPDPPALVPTVDTWPSVGHQGATWPSTEGSPTTLEETPPHHSSGAEHPDPNNFLFPEFIPELSLDLGYPHPPPLHPYPPDLGNNVPTTTGTGLNQPASAILNCLLAHQLCAEDPSCKSIETVIQHICGPETVACSTTTVTKCQAGLRTLQAFPVFHPTCLCREPSVDPDCNAFRDSLFDHPCMVSTQKERDLYPIHALPTCTHALDVCQKDPSCTRLYNDFREHCKLRSGVCRDKETCYNAWRGLRMTPLFGCFCPGSDQKKCERIYSFIYNNTCVGLYLVANVHDSSIPPVMASGQFARSIANGRSVAHNEGHNKPTALDTSTTPFQHRPTTSTTTTNTTKVISTITTTTTTPIEHEHSKRHLPRSSVHLLRERTFDDDATASGSWQDSLNRQRETDARQIESRLMDSQAGLLQQHGNDSHHHAGAEAGSIDVARFSHFLHSALTRTRIGYHQTAAAAAGGAHHSTTANSTGAQQPSLTSSSSSSVANLSSNHIGGDDVMEPGVGRVVSIYQSTCHRALTHCQSDGQCRKHLEPFLRYCNGGVTSSGLDTCHRDLCMQALQGFYKDAPLQWSLEVAFCVCKKSQNRNDECLLAQEKLHPDCARRPERYHLPAPAGQSPGVSLGTNEASPTHHTPGCHHLAEECKAHPDCKPRLEFYVQACAVDIVTKGCAGPPSICRRAVLDILGTDLRTTCTCKTAQQMGDLAAMYDCTEWQRLLWLNPCVVEAQRDFHKIQGNLKVVTVPSATTSPSGDALSTGSSWATTTTGRHVHSTVTSGPEDDLFTVVVPRKTQRPSSTGGQRLPTSPVPSTTVTWSTDATRMTASTSATTADIITQPTIPAKYCTLERPNRRVIHFPEGTSKRLYHDDDPDCSELCRCGVGQVVTCSIADCAQRKPCQTSAAVYAHAATAFQAYRGECLCFSGALVCAKPDPGQYSLPSGVFLFVGYSQADEKAIYQFTHTNVSRSLLTGLQRLMYSSFRETASETECRMSIHDQVDENLILQIRLAALDDQRVNNSVTLEMLTQEKAQCLPVANRIRQMISKRLPIIREDEVLSVVKVADTTSVLPEPRRSSAGRLSQSCWIVLALVCSTLAGRTHQLTSCR